MAKAKTAGEFKIESGVPLPPLSGRNAFPFEQMSIGDSFWTQAVTYVRTAATKYGKYHQKKFTVRKEGDGAASGG